MSEAVKPKEKQLEFFYEDKFVHENSLKILEGNSQYKNRELKTELYGVMEKVESEIFEDAVDVSKRFLELKRIVDNFGIDHTSRRKWRVEMVGKYCYSLVSISLRIS